jgi:tetratricopeptide (TPR) repeat protein
MLIQRVAVCRLAAALLIAAMAAPAFGQDSKPETSPIPEAGATIDRLKAAFEKSPKDVEVNIKLAEAYLVYGNLQAARRHADRAQAAAPKDPRGSVTVGHVLFRMGESAADGDTGGLMARSTFADAATAYEEALAAGAEPYATSFWAADAWDRSGAPAKALTAIEGALRARPDDPGAKLVKGRLLIADGRGSEAATLLEQIIAAVPGTEVAGDAAVEAIRARLRVGDRSAVPESFARLTRGDPHGAAARIHRMVAAAFGGTRDEEVWAGMLESAAKASPDDPLVIYWRAALAARRKDGTGLLALADRYKRARPDDPDSRVFRAIALRLLGRLDEARIEIVRAYDRAPKHAPAREEMQYLVKAFFDARRYREAAEVQELVAHATGAPADRYDHAVLLLDAGMKDEARRVYDAICADESLASTERSRAANALALLRRSEGDLVGAVQALQRAIQWNPDNLDAYENLGILRLREGEPAAGMKDLEEAIARSPKTDPPRKRSHYHLWRARHPEVP